MANLTPKQALAAYRDHALNTPPEIQEQAEMFDKMSIKDRLSLLFYMQLHVMNMIQPPAAQVVDVGDLRDVLKKPN